jgi:hypothetical protein
MTDFELTRASGDRRLFSIPGVGTLRDDGFRAGTTTATSADGDASWTLSKHGFWRRTIRASDAVGTVIGEFTGRTFSRGGRLWWDGREMTIDATSTWRSRFALVEDGRDLVVFDAKGWGRRPVLMAVEEPGAVEPGLLLFATFVVRRVASDSSSDGGAASTAAMSG